MNATQLCGPYGAVRYQSGTLPTSKGFTGQRSDASTSGLDYYNARYYDPVAGQFTSADATLAGGLNRYAYVGGNPETFVDPSGHELRPGAEGEGAELPGGEGNNVGVGGGGGGSSDENLPTVTANGSELTYGEGTAGSVHFYVQNGQIDGVDGPDGQLLETNAQIEAQAEADSQDRLNQGEQTRGDMQGSSTEGNAATPNDLVHQAENVRTEDGTTSHAAGVVATINGTTISATSGPPSTSDVGIGDGSTCGECHFGQEVTTQFPQGPNGERTLKGQTINVGLSQVSGRSPCPTCQTMFGELEDYTGASFTVWSADRGVPRGPIIGVYGPLSAANHWGSDLP